MTPEQTILQKLTKLAIPEVLLDRAGVALMCREGLRPDALNKLMHLARTHWKKAAPSALEAHVNACLMRAALIVTRRLPAFA